MKKIVIVPTSESSGGAESAATPPAKASTSAKVIANVFMLITWFLVPPADYGR
jgi:hypothetical protein